jgi:hypothetical protein
MLSEEKSIVMVQYMWKWLDETLVDFRICFSRKAAFKWFVVIIISMMIGTEHSGVTSVIRELSLSSRYYESILNFFHASSWKIETIRDTWISLVKKNAPILEVEGYHVLAGDGVKHPKEAKKMPGVKKHHQESENVSKAEYIFGHLFGAVGVLAGGIGKMFCIPLSASIQDGVNTIREWVKSDCAVYSHVEQVIHLAGECTNILGKSIIVLDRLFLSVNALNFCRKYMDATGEWMLHIVTKAKKSAVAYEDPPSYSGKGRPPKKGKSIKLWSLFDEYELFEPLKVQIYGKVQTVKYRTINLLWGLKLYQKLQFVFVILEDGRKSILVSTLLNLSPTQIIEIYSWRFKIEIQFKELKNTLGGFAYHFWSKHMPKLLRFGPAKNNLLEGISDPHSRELIIGTLKAIEGYMMLACVALGMLQMIALKFGSAIKLSGCLWLRTQTNDIPTEATVARYLSKNIFRVIEKYRISGIYRIIRDKQEHVALDDYSEVS